MKEILEKNYFLIYLLVNIKIKNHTHFIFFNKIIYILDISFGFNKWYF